MSLSVSAAHSLLYCRFRPQGLVRRINLKRTVLPLYVNCESSNRQNLPGTRRDISSNRRDFRSFKPPPPAPPAHAQDLAKDLPFHYWYSYSDLAPDIPKRRPKSNPSLVADVMQRWDPSYLEELAGETEEDKQEELVLRDPRKHGNEATPTKVAGTRETVSKRRLERNSLALDDPSNKRNSSSSDELAGDTETAMAILRTDHRWSSNGTYTKEQAATKAQIPKSKPALVADGSNKWHPPSSKKLADDRDVSKSGVLLLTNSKRNMIDLEGEGKLVEATKVDKPKSLCNTNAKQGRINMKSEGKQEQEMSDPKVDAPLSEKEVFQLVDACHNSNRQINVGWAGWSQNNVGTVHSYWKKAPVCKIKVKGLPTLDLDGFCNTLEEKTGGKVIQRAGGTVYLFRGRNYKYWRDAKVPPVKRKHIANWVNKRLPIPKMLTKEDFVALRDQGRELPALCRPCENGVYLTLLNDVRTAFQTQDLVRINCQTYNAKHLKALGAKLQELVPCELISYECEHILMWKGKDLNCSV